MKKTNWFLGIILLIILLEFSYSCDKVKNENKINTTPLNTVSDIDGNIYHIVTIGTQVWMVENLKVTRYRNGDTIPNGSTNVPWDSLTTGSYCNNNNDTNYIRIYGRLYNWYATIDTRNIAPTGWHVPSSAEWQTLFYYLGGGMIAGGKIKEEGTIHWQSPNTGATNSSGFTALPAGCYSTTYGLSGIGLGAMWWATTSVDSSEAWMTQISYNYEGVTGIANPKNYGVSIRCIKD